GGLLKSEKHAQREVFWAAHVLRPRGAQSQGVAPEGRLFPIQQTTVNSIVWCSQPADFLLECDGTASMPAATSTAAWAAGWIMRMKVKAYRHYWTRVSENRGHGRNWNADRDECGTEIVSESVKRVR